PLLAYKCKDDLVLLAGALSLSMEGMVTELTKAIKDHLIESPSHAVMNRPGLRGLGPT
ncbi:hypothetical protein PAXRUDRAFT_139675, partial [Paxillus rubicundulus Ve08.2h10]